MYVWRIRRLRRGGGECVATHTCSTDRHITLYYADITWTSNQTTGNNTVSSTVYLDVHQTIHQSSTLLISPIALYYAVYQSLNKFVLNVPRWHKNTDYCTNVTRFDDRVLLVAIYDRYNKAVRPYNEVTKGVSGTGMGLLTRFSIKICNSIFLTWLVIGLQNSRQPIRSNVIKWLSTNSDFNREVFSNSYRWTLNVVNIKSWSAPFSGMSRLSNCTATQPSLARHCSTQLSRLALPLGVLSAPVVSARTSSCISTWAQFS